MRLIKIVIDVMSPAQQSIVDLVEILSKIDGVAKVNVSLSELERDVMEFKVTMEGHDIHYEKIIGAIKEFGGVIRNVDNVMAANEYLPGPDNDKISASMLVLAHHFDSKIDIEGIYREFDRALNYLRARKV